MPVAERLRLLADALTPAERETYEERAAIREYDGGMDRAEAEQAALQDVRRMRAQAQERQR